MFQSTRPHGARPGQAGNLLRKTSFNPRARTGRDQGLYNPRKSRLLETLFANLFFTEKISREKIDYIPANTTKTSLCEPRNVFLSAYGSH